MTNPSAVDLEGVIEGLEVARDALARAPHGDNCFLHDDGGEYDRCFCGKDSVVAHLEGLLGRVILDAPEVEIEQARENVRRALHAADNGNHAGELAVVKMAQAASELSRLQAENEGLRKALEAYDAKVRECPIQGNGPEARRARSKPECPECGATASGSCGKINSASYRFEQAVRAALAPNGEVGG